MRTRLAVIVAGLGLLLSAGPTLAHHAFAAEYDAKKPVKLTGTVTKLEWLNPHTWFYVDVKDDSGKVTNWGFEMGSPNILLRAGWTRNSMSPVTSLPSKAVGQGREQQRERQRGNSGQHWSAIVWGSSQGQ